MLDDEKKHSDIIWKTIDEIIAWIVISNDETETNLQRKRAESEVTRMHGKIELINNKYTQTAPMTKPKNRLSLRKSKDQDTPQTEVTVLPPLPPPPPPPLPPPLPTGFFEINKDYVINLPISEAIVKPTHKMRKLQWNKIPNHVLRRSSQNNVWNKVMKVDDGELDYSVGENLFCQQNKIVTEQKKEKNKEPKQVFCA